MKKDNKELLEKVIEDRLNKSLEDGEDGEQAFQEAMDAIDRQIEMDKNNKDRIIKCVEIGAAVLLAPMIEAGCRKAFTKMVCNFEKDYTFTTTAGRSLSSIFRFK